MSIRRRIKVETRDRKDVLNEAIVTQDEILEKFFAQPKKFQFLFGAGMSASAGVPLSQLIIDEIIVKVFEKTNPAKRGQMSADDLKEWVSREKWFNPNFGYISALEKEYPSVYLRTELFKRYMRGRFPSPAQLMYAIGVKEEKLANRSYTTNWDTLAEDAFYWLRGVNCVTIKGPDQLREVKDFDHNYVVKLHGDLDRYDVRYLREGMAKHNDDLKDFLAKSMSNAGLMVIGYSGTEYSVMNMLMELVHDYEDVLNGGLYWAYQGNTKHIPEVITDLMAIGLDKGKDFRIFESEDADFLFEKIASQLDFTSIEEELSVAFVRFNKMSYGNLRKPREAIIPGLANLAQRDLLDEGFLVRDYNTILETWKQDSSGMFRKKEEKERAAKDAERKLINHCFNDLKSENYADAEVKLKDVHSRFPDNPMVDWGLGWAQYKTGRYEESLASFDRALSFTPKDVGIYIAKALCYHFQGQPAQEMKMYDQVLEIKGDLDYIWYNRGLAAAKLGEHTVERDSYQQAVQINPGNHLAWYNLGLCHQRDGRSLIAIRAFNRAREINPRLFESFYNEGVLMGKMGQDTQALLSFDMCISLNQEDDESFKSRGISEVMTGQYEAAVESYEEYLSANPEDEEAWANYGLALYGIEQLDDGMAYTEKYLERNPEDARIWYNKALILYQQGDKQGAMAAFDKSLSLNDDYDMVWYKKALLMGEMEMYEGEIEFLTRFLNRNEQDLRGWFELGEANRRLGEDATDIPAQQRYFTAAVTAYDHALDVQRTDLRTWLYKTKCLNKLHRYEEALECIKYLMRYDKENAEVHYQKGVALDGLGDQLGSSDALAECLKLDANHADAFYLRGLLLAELEQYAKAVDHFDNVIRLDEDRWQAWHFKGLCVVKQKEYTKALEIFDLALTKFRGNPRFMVDQALAYVMMREIESAREKLRGAIAIDATLKDEIVSTPEFAGLVL
ncbi:tetratricopeptide repeat protein [bacterium]|nr:tetratricopeptide repeat protein [bacterium]